MLRYQKALASVAAINVQINASHSNEGTGAVYAGSPKSLQPRNMPQIMIFRAPYNWSDIAQSEGVGLMGMFYGTLQKVVSEPNSKEHAFLV